MTQNTSRASRDRCVDVLMHFTYVGTPLTLDEFNARIGIVEPEHFEALDKYLELGEDNIVRRRSLDALLDWAERRRDAVSATWATLGIKNR